MNKKTNLIWIDLEMTGLIPEYDVIIEIATVVTDAQLNVVDEGPSIAIHQSNELLDEMDEWNTNQHNRSGLVKRVQESKISIAEAESQTLNFLMNYVDWYSIRPSRQEVHCFDGWLLKDLHLLH